MLKETEIEILRENAKVHRKVFNEIQKIVKPGIHVLEIDKLCGEICKENGVLAGFKGVYNFPANICISINDVVVHGVPRAGVILKEGDVVKFDFGVKDKKVGVNTDAAFTMIVGEGPYNAKVLKFLEANKKGLYAGIEKARAGNNIGDISYAIQKAVEGEGFHIVKELTGHGIGKKLHEKPYVYNYGKPGTGPKILKGMTLAIEPIIGFSTGNIMDKGDFEIYMADGGLGCQFEHTILITDGEAEIII